MIADTLVTEVDNKHTYKILEADVSPESDLKTTVQAGTVKFSESGEKLVWDDKFVEKVSSVDVRDLTATVQHRTVQRAMLDIFTAEEHGNRKVRTLGISLIAAALVIVAVTFTIIWTNNSSSITPESGITTQSDADITSEFRKKDEIIK